MDEGFFLYSEDVDYCWQVRRAGWAIAHEPAARVVHHRGGSGPAKAMAQARSRVPAYVYASRTRLFYRLYGWLGLLAGNLLWTLGAMILQARRLVDGTDARPAAREWRDIWINFLDPLGDSRQPRS